MVLVPATEGFRVGSESKDASLAERPVRTVKLRAFCIDKTEVTVAQYRKCVTEARAGTACPPAPTTVSGTAYDTEAQKPWAALCNGDRKDRDDHPINCVEWTTADTYCRWAGKALPTEAQWEYAARGPESRPFPWGEQAPTTEAVKAKKLLNACGKECRPLAARLLTPRLIRSMYDVDDGAEGTAPVGSYPDGQSPFGALDMAGNVLEWVVDSWGSYDAAQTDNPVHDKPAAIPLRVVRGSDWATTAPSDARASARYSQEVQERRPTVGFRCASPPAGG